MTLLHKISNTVNNFFILETERWSCHLLIIDYEIYATAYFMCFSVYRDITIKYVFFNSTGQLLLIKTKGWGPYLLYCLK